MCDRTAIMTRAWAIFRQTYCCYPQIKFSDIGRKCFACCLRRPSRDHIKPALAYRGAKGWRDREADWPSCYSTRVTRPGAVMRQT
jgi:hypothetical protein